MMRIRPVDRYRYRDYLKRAQECANAMDRAYETGEWNACVINAVHCGVSAADALCVATKGVHHAGERHGDAISLLISIDPKDDEIKNISNRLSRLLGVKTGAEYGEKLMGAKDAEDAKRDAEKISDLVKGKLAKMGV